MVIIATDLFAMGSVMIKCRVKITVRNEVHPFPCPCGDDASGSRRKQFLECCLKDGTHQDSHVENWPVREKQGLQKKMG